MIKAYRCINRCYNTFIFQTYIYAHDGLAHQYASSRMTLLVPNGVLCSVIILYQMINTVLVLINGQRLIYICDLRGYLKVP